MARRVTHLQTQIIVRLGVDEDGECQEATLVLPPQDEQGRVRGRIPLTKEGWDRAFEEVMKAKAELAGPQAPEE